MDCIFCKIIKNEISSYNIYEDEIVKVFLDISPDSNGHMLIVPKKHIVDINDMDNKTFEHILIITKKMRKILEQKLNIDGLTLVQNNGLIQDVKHFHLHLKPYYKNNVLKDVKEINEILNQAN